MKMNLILMSFNTEGYIFYFFLFPVYDCVVLSFIIDPQSLAMSIPCHLR